MTWRLNRLNCFTQLFSRAGAHPCSFASCKILYLLIVQILHTFSALLEQLSVRTGAHEDNQAGFPTVI